MCKMGSVHIGRGWSGIDNWNIRPSLDILECNSEMLIFFSANNPKCFICSRGLWSFPVFCTKVHRRGWHCTSFKHYSWWEKQGKCRPNPTMHFHIVSNEFSQPLFLIPSLVFIVFSELHGLEPCGPTCGGTAEEGGRQFTSESCHPHTSTGGLYYITHGWSADII